MKIEVLFNDFLSDIRLTKNQKDDLKTGHKTLRSRLQDDETLSSLIIGTFLQGSYRRSTAVRPNGGRRADVDVIVVTNLDKNLIHPDKAINKFLPFLDKHYKGKYRLQGRSIGIELSYVDLDVVITSAPSEVDRTKYSSKSILSELALDDFNDDYSWRLVNGWNDPDTNNYQRLSESLMSAAEWKLEPLLIPDRDVKKWVETHPLEQIRWTREKNATTNKHYINVVKALKWWRLMHLESLKHPKGYPLEHMIGDCCPYGIDSVAQGVVETMEAIVRTYATERQLNRTPYLKDRGVPSHNVWKRIDPKDFVTFYDAVENWSKVARKAYDAVSLVDQVKYWQELFGSKFPSLPKDDGKGSGNSSSKTDQFTERDKLTNPLGSRFA